MPLQLPRFKDIGFEEANPWQTGLSNALKQQLTGLEGQKIQAELPFIPLKSIAQSASQLAYANLTGPQFIAKLFQNPDFQANTNGPLKDAMLHWLIGAGSSQSNVINEYLKAALNKMGGNQSSNPLQAIFGNGQNQYNPPQQNSMNNPMWNGNQQPSVQTQKSPTALTNRNRPYNNDMSKMDASDNPSDKYNNLTNTDRNNINNMKPGDSYVVGSNQSPNQYNPPQNWERNRARRERAIEQGKEEGKLRAKDIQQFEDISQQNSDTRSTLDYISDDLMSDPEFKKLRTIPFAGQHEISWYAQNGTKEQKELIGKLRPVLGQLVVDMSKEFKGAFRGTEQGLIEKAKPSESDMPDVFSGKVEAMNYLAQLAEERSKAAAYFMRNHDMSKTDAMTAAKKHVSGKEILSKVQDKMNPTVTLRNKKTGETTTVPYSKAQKMLRGT